MAEQLVEKKGDEESVGGIELERQHDDNSTTEYDEAEEDCVNAEGSVKGEEPGGGKRKKKKKKKKKKNHAQCVDPIVAKMISSIKSNDEELLWVRLNSRMMNDETVSLLCEALDANTHVLSLDVSDNDITETGMVALCECLAGGGARDLIELDVRKNACCFTNVLDESMDDEDVLGHVVALRRMMCARRVLKVSYEDAADVHRAGDATSGYSSIVQDLFQRGNGDDDDEGEDASRDRNTQTTAQNLAQLEELNLEDEDASLWDEIITCFSAAKDMKDADQLAIGEVSPLMQYTQQLSSCLFTLNEYLAAELHGCQLPLLEDTGMDDLQLFLSSTISNLHILDRVLDIEVCSIFPAQYQPDSKTPRIGSHRVMAATLVATAMEADCPVVTQAVSATSILEKILCLSVQFPSCSAIHSQCLKIAKISMSDASGPIGLWRRLVYTSQCSEARAACHPNDAVYQKIFDAIQEAEKNVPGRNMLSGFCIRLLDLLRQGAQEQQPLLTSDTSTQSSFSRSYSSFSADNNGQKTGREWKDELAHALEGFDRQGQAWPALDALLEVQHEQLGGPPPERIEDFDNLHDSMNFAGPQLLALLQGLNFQ